METVSLRGECLNKARVTWGLGNKEFKGWEKEGSRERVTREEIFEECEKVLPFVNFFPAAKIFCKTSGNFSTYRLLPPKICFENGRDAC